MFSGGEFQLEALKVQRQSSVITKSVLPHVQVGAFLKTSGQDVVNTVPPTAYSRRSCERQAPEAVRPRVRGGSSGSSLKPSVSTQGLDSKSCLLLS